MAAEKAVLQKENEELKGDCCACSNDLLENLLTCASFQAQLAAKDAEVLRLQHVNRQTQQEHRPNQLIPRPPGERGKNGWNLQKHMGLENDPEAYHNIRVSQVYTTCKFSLSFLSHLAWCPVCRLRVAAQYLAQD